MTIVQVFKTTFRVVHMVYSSHLYPRAEPRGFTLQWINSLTQINAKPISPPRLLIVKVLILSDYLSNSADGALVGQLSGPS